MRATELASVRALKAGFSGIPRFIHRTGRLRIHMKEKIYSVVLLAARSNNNMRACKLMVGQRVTRQIGLHLSSSTPCLRQTTSVWLLRPKETPGNNFCSQFFRLGSNICQLLGFLVKGAALPKPGAPTFPTTEAVRVVHNDE